MSKAEDLKAIELQIIDAKARMNDCLSAGNLRKAESYSDLLRSLQMMLRAVS